MIHESDIQRLFGTDKDKERLIGNAMKACERSTTDWSKNFWFNTWKHLCQKFGRSDLYNKHLH